MTFCLGIRVKEGLVAIADTRITSGTETTTAKKITLYSGSEGSLFLMTSGLRSIRDKAVTYFEEILENEHQNFEKMYQAVNAFGVQLRRVGQEDKAELTASGLTFNLFTIVGGKLDKDKDHKLFLLYPEGNWIEIGDYAPFAIIGNSGYGKPILNRTIKYESTLRFALKTGFLSFDSTRVSANDVGFPIDVVIYKSATQELIEKRFEESEMQHISSMWDSRLSAIIKEIPEEWIDQINSLAEQSDNGPLISHDQ